MEDYMPRDNDKIVWGEKKFPAEVQEQYLEFIRMGYSKRKAAEDVGVSNNVIWNYRKQNPDFEEAIAQAEYEACDLVEDVLMEKILLDRHYPAIVFWLCNRANYKWKDIRQITMTTPDDANAQKAVVHDILTRLKEEEKKNEFDKS
jgi:hypothetical protein